MSLHSTIKSWSNALGFKLTCARTQHPRDTSWNLLCFPQHLKYRAGSAIFPQDILCMCREKTPLSKGNETFVSLLDGSELCGDRKTEEIFCQFYYSIVIIRSSINVNKTKWLWLSVPESFHWCYTDEECQWNGAVNEKLLQSLPLDSKPACTPKDS